MKSLIKDKASKVAAILFVSLVIAAGIYGVITNIIFK